jgi:hypothetical protein
MEQVDHNLSLRRVIGPQLRRSRVGSLSVLVEPRPAVRNATSRSSPTRDAIRDFIADLRQKQVTSHVARKIRGSAIGGRTTRRRGYAVSQRKRKLVEVGTTIAGMAKLKVRGLPCMRHAIAFAMAVYNLIRMPILLAAEYRRTKRQLVSTRTRSKTLKVALALRSSSTLPPSSIAC